MSDDGDPTLSVAQDLRAIIDLSDDLHEQAASKATAREMPGGDAMVMLGPVSSPTDRERRGELIEADWQKAHGWKWCEEHESVLEQCEHRLNPWVDEDANWEPPLQTLLFWTEQLHEVGNRPTVQTEATWLGENLRWLYDNEPHWDDFAKDVASARRRLEAVLYAGERDARAVVRCACGGSLVSYAGSPRPCNCPTWLMQIHDQHGPCTCRRVLATEWRQFSPPSPLATEDIVFAILDNPDPAHVHQRRGVSCLACYWQRRHSNHNQGGRGDTWQCQICQRRYDSDEYRERVAADARDNATALPAVMMVERFTSVTVGQLRVWANRGKVRRHGRDELGRMLYDVEDVKRRAEQVVLASE